MVNNHYRWDFIGLSTDDKPTASTSEKVVNGSTYYCSDNSKLYVYCDGTWYERKPLGGGGGGGTSDFDELENRPKYNGTTMTGETNIPEVKTYTAGTNVAISDQNVISATDTTYSNFVGTDGTSAGAAGLVPAPATTDAGKFLKADGTWDTAGGGGGDTVYSSVTTSNSSTGGAVYIGNLDSSQVEQTDPTASDTHTKYFWALPYSNTAKPGSDSINILGEITGSIARANVITLHGYGINSNTVISIGGQYSQAPESVAVGHSSSIMSNGSGGTALGYSAKVNHMGGVALGYQASTTRAGEVNIGTVNTSYGFGNSTYRVIGGVHDGQSAHDAVTVGQVNAVIDAINTALSTNIPHIGA